MPVKKDPDLVFCLFTAGEPTNQLVEDVVVALILGLLHIRVNILNAYTLGASEAGSASGPAV